MFREPETVWTSARTMELDDDWETGLLSRRVVFLRRRLHGILLRPGMSLRRISSVLVGMPLRLLLLQGWRCGYRPWTWQKLWRTSNARRRSPRRCITVIRPRLTVNRSARHGVHRLMMLLLLLLLLLSLVSIDNSSQLINVTLEDPQLLLIGMSRSYNLHKTLELMIRACSSCKHLNDRVGRCFVLLSGRGSRRWWWSRRHWRWKSIGWHDWGKKARVGSCWHRRRCWS